MAAELKNIVKTDLHQKFYTSIVGCREIGCTEHTPAFIPKPAATRLAEDVWLDLW